MPSTICPTTKPCGEIKPASPSLPSATRAVSPAIFCSVRSRHILSRWMTQMHMPNETIRSNGGNCPGQMPCDNSYACRSADGKQPIYQDRLARHLPNGKHRYKKFKVKEELSRGYWQPAIFRLIDTKYPMIFLARASLWLCVWCPSARCFGLWKRGSWTEDPWRSSSFRYGYRKWRNSDIPLSCW